MKTAAPEQPGEQRTYTMGSGQTIRAEVRMAAPPSRIGSSGPRDERSWSTLSSRWNWLLLAALTALLLLVAGCASTSTKDMSPTERAAASAGKGWLASFFERVGDRIGEIALSIGAGLVTAALYGADLVTGGVVSLATLAASFAFRPAQVVNNVDTGGGNYSSNGGGDGMGFLEWIGLATLIVLAVKYLVIPRSARNFWGGLIGMLTKKGKRLECAQRMISATGMAHTSKDTASVAKGTAVAVPTEEG